MDLFRAGCAAGMAQAPLAQQGCSAGTVEQDPEIAPPREKLTTRAGRWATRQAGRARPVGEVAAELGCQLAPGERWLMLSRGRGMRP